jgi:SNF2 family DNA or RNA helicase
MGQLSEVTVYYFTSGAGVEKAVLSKQLDKSEVINSLMRGTVNRLTKPLKLAAFANGLVEVKDNIDLIDKLYINQA